MRRLLVLGAGKIGGAIVDLLGASGDWEVTVADQQQEFLALIPEDRAKHALVDVADPVALAALAQGHEYVVSALPFFLNPTVARVCRTVEAHYFDLTEDVATTRTVREVADGASTAFVPQCGLAPGFISIAAHDLAKKFDRLREVRMRVGALPQYPLDTLKYNLTWSTDGLINEYCNPCEAIRDGRLVEMLPLEGLESFSLDGVDYEAFNTSGGLGTLCETLDGKVDRLDYKTVRYPGHRDVMKMLLEDLRLRDRRELLKDVLERSVPITHQDVVLIFVSVSGWRDARLTQETSAKKVYAHEVEGRLMSAIQLTTASGICAMVDLHAKGQLPQTGFVRQEGAVPGQPLRPPLRVAVVVRGACRMGSARAQRGSVDPPERLVANRRLQNRERSPRRPEHGRIRGRPTSCARSVVARRIHRRTSGRIHSLLRLGEPATHGANRRNRRRAGAVVPAQFGDDRVG